MSKPVAVVVGVGPGLGAALARRYASEGYAVAALARRGDALDEATSGIADCRNFVCDPTDGAAVEEGHGATPAGVGAVPAEQPPAASPSAVSAAGTAATAHFLETAKTETATGFKP